MATALPRGRTVFRSGRAAANHVEGSAEDRLSGFIAGLLFDSRFEDRTRTYAVFGELVFKATPDINVTLGATLVVIALGWRGWNAL